jgi:WD40 repeat protein
MDLSDFLPKKFKSNSDTKDKNESSSKNKLTKDNIDLNAFLPTEFGKRKSEKKYYNKKNENILDTKPTNSAKEDISGSSKISSQISEEEKTEQTQAQEVTSARNNITSQKPKNSNFDDETDEDDYDPLEDFEPLPITNMAKLASGSKAISAMAIDPSGSRMITGDYAYDLKFYDFNGMDSTLRPFKDIEPSEGNRIKDLKFSLSGGHILLAPGNSQAKILDRDGKEVEQCVKGDMYLRDLKLTMGHIGELTCCQWHPTDHYTYLTASEDGTVRVWEVESSRKQKSIIIIKSGPRAQRSVVTAASFSQDGKYIAAASRDGALALWPSNGPFISPSHKLEKAHEPNTDTSHILFSQMEHNFYTRGGDGTVKLWDIRNFKSPVLRASNLPTNYSETNLSFSPDEKLIVTGSSGLKTGESGRLNFLDKTSLEIVKSFEVGSSSVIKTFWHPTLNQIATGSGDGSLNLFYDPEHSKKGALLCVNRQPRKIQVDEISYDPYIITPDDDKEIVELPKRVKTKKRSDPVASQRPDLPVNGQGHGGRVGTNYTNFMMKHLMKDNTRFEDPREAILRHAKEAEENPFWVAPAYQQTQPKALFNENQEEEPKKERKTSDSSKKSA